MDPNMNGSNPYCLFDPVVEVRVWIPDRMADVRSGRAVFVVDPLMHLIVPFKLVHIQWAPNLKSTTRN